MAYQKVKKMMHTVYSTYPDLELPGHIMYIYSIQRRAGFGQSQSARVAATPEYDSRWAQPDEFKKILITNRIIMDHFPNTVDNALKYFSTTSSTSNTNLKNMTVNTIPPSRVASTTAILPSSTAAIIN